MAKLLLKFVLAVLIVAIAPTAADARKRGYYQGFYAPQDDGDERERRQVEERYAPRAGGASVGAIVFELARGCHQQAAEFKAWPLDRIVGIVSPDAEQRRALEALREVSLATADTLSAECPPLALPAVARRGEVARERGYAAGWPVDARRERREGWANPPTPWTPAPPATTGRRDAGNDARAAARSVPALRLDAAERAIDAVTAALTAVQPAVRDVYVALDDEQKARLLRDLGGEAAARSGDQRRWRDAAGVPWGGMCERLVPALRNWPGKGIERAMRLSDAQRVVLYELYAAALKAADTLASACPPDTALTPLRRIEVLRARLASVRAATTAIRPALMRFHDALDGDQQQRFAQMI